MQSADMHDHRATIRIHTRGPRRAREARRATARLGMTLPAGATLARASRAAAESPLAAFEPANATLALLLGAAGLLALGLGWLARRRRPRGGVTVEIDFPQRIEGDFVVALRRTSLRRSGARGSARGGARRPTGPPPPAPHRRAGVRRETQLDGVAPGIWYARIEGRLSAPRSGAELARIEREQELRVVADATTPIRFELPTVEARVELRVHWDRQPARDFGTSLRGRPETLRYSGQGVARLSLVPGRHALLIGAGDRVIEHAITVEDYEPGVVSVDLADHAGLVFKGCPPAVPYYLQGDLGGAARALERDGQHEVASGLIAELHREQGQTERAAQALEQAGRLLEAAELRRQVADFANAARLYEAAEARREAAEMFAAAGDWPHAARLFTALEDWEGAARACERAGDQAGLITALEAQGAWLRAAALASESGDRARAIRILQQVGPQEPDHGRASELLVLAFEQEGHLDLAAQQLERRLSLLAEDEPAPALELQLAELYGALGNEARALELLERLRDRDPTYPRVASRIEGLRRQRARRERDSGATPFTPPPGATAFVAESRYEIVREIGRGGMGQVYQARDRRLGREVALKRMPAGLRDHPTAVSLFLGEAQAAARLNHPNIVTLYDADQEAGHFFITMELLGGLPLSTLLERHGPFGARDTARLGLQACAGLGYAHAHGVIHRDIKTANLFVTHNKVLKIMDFGLAKMVEAVRDGGSTLIVGSPDYMAPEQRAGERVDARADLYALGVTLYELATGQLPPRSAPDAAGSRALGRTGSSPPDPADIAPSLPRALSTLIQRLLEPAREDRPESAEQVARTLTHFLDTDLRRTNTPAPTGPAKSAPLTTPPNAAEEAARPEPRPTPERRRTPPPPTP